MRRVWVGATVVAVSVIGAALTADAADYGLVAESSGCGYPRFVMPHAGRRGTVPDSHLIRGPAGALFGRTVGQVRTQLVNWEVPNSGGATVSVHRRLLPPLREVEANLAGRRYPIRRAETFGFTPRTTVSHDGLSYHALGAAVDVNSTTNPYRSDGKLVTDMPAWFVAAWTDAGFCWGGYWIRVKDPMHFSWMGPLASPSYPSLPAPYPPLTSAAAFAGPVERRQVVFGDSTHPRLLADASGDGAVDVGHLRPWGAHTIFELSVSRAGLGECSVRRWWLGDPPSGQPHLADPTGVGRPDLLFLDTSAATLRFARYGATASYEPVDGVVTGVATRPGLRVAFGDANRDGRDDLWVIEPVPDGTRVEIWSAFSGYLEKVREGVVSGLHLSDEARVLTADRTVDGREELMVVVPAAQGSVVYVVAAADLSRVAEVVAGPTLVPTDVVAATDYDGDGRPDLVVLAADGELAAYLGNSPLTGVVPSSWFLAPDFECPEGAIPYHHQGTFADDDDSVFSADIEWLAAAGITRGCNPPFNDWFCPDQAVTRAQMAAFLNRALGLAAAPNRFVDAAGSVFEADIGALAAAGITRGCNPPANDRFCPDRAVSRGEMAAFLRRAGPLLSQR